MNAYQELRIKHQKEFNEFPMHFAFGQEQIDRKIKELGLSKDPKKRAEQIVGIGGGGFVLKKDYPAFIDMCRRHAKERAEAIAEGENGGTYLYDMFRTELENHEFGYTGSYSDTLYALGLTLEEIEAKPAMKEAFEKAVNDIIEWENEHD